MATVTNRGLDELMQQFETLPERLATNASPIVGRTASEMAAAVVQAYPMRTGDLRNSVKVEERTSGSDSVRYVVVNTSEHAWWFEHGTQVRRTALGWNRGQMPPGHVWIPEAQRQRRAMYPALRGMLEAEGLTVHGDV